MDQISGSIIQWYHVAKRDLPWRQTTDPYHIWLSEVILQQTRIAQGLAYYNKFLEIFPNVEILANASEDQVLEHWQGLGYYSRARNLHASAKYISSHFNGKFPENYEGLIQLKGIGDYTASAIASFAFHEDKVVVDGNVIRVVSRLLGIDSDVRQAKTVIQLKSFVESILPKGESYFFNQGIMELGALICIPRNPKCGECPIQTHCVASKKNLTEVIPFKSKLKTKKVRFLNYLLIEAKNEFLFIKRGAGDIWEGLYEPLLIEAETAFDSFDSFIGHEILSDPNNAIENVRLLPAKKHILTHQELWVTLCLVRLKIKPPVLAGVWVKTEKLNATPKPIIISKLLSALEAGQLHLDFKS